MSDAPQPPHNQSCDSPNRSSADPVVRESRERNRHVTFALTLKQSFDGGGKKSAGVAQAAEQG